MKKVTLLKALAFPATAAFMVGVGNAVVLADETTPDIIPSDNNTVVDAKSVEQTQDDTKQVAINASATVADTTDESKVETQPVSNDSNTNESQGVETQSIVEATNTNESETNNSVQTQENPEVDVVAKIGDTAYASLDDALSAAQDNDTINLYKDATTKNGFGINGKAITIQGNGHAITADTLGIYLRKDGNKIAVLNFVDSTVNLIPANGTPTLAGEGYKWANAVVNYDCQLNLSNTKFYIKGGYGPGTGIYFHSGGSLTLDNASEMKIFGLSGNAIESDENDGANPYKVGVNVLNKSNLDIQTCRSGLVGQIETVVSNSNLTVDGMKTSGSNGADYTITNNSTVKFDNNVYHGMSTRHLTINDSTFTATNNGMDGIVMSGNGHFIKANVTITGTQGKSNYSAGMRLLGSKANLSIDKDSIINITDNKVSGIFLDKNSHLTVDEGANILVTRNHAEQENIPSKNNIAQSGGGIFVRSNAVANLSNSTQVYNNHANYAGDDIFVEDGGHITFGNTGEGWKLDGDPDCTDSINGWYDDQADSRWEAHSENHESDHTEKVNAGTYNGVLALKAAHNNGTVIAHYVDEAGNQIADNETYKDAVGNEYTTEAKTINKYTLIKVPENNNGTYTEDDINVYYVYTLTKGKVVAHYVDENGNTIAKDETYEDVLDNPYQTVKKDIAGYVFVSVDGQETGVFKDGTIEVTYKYKKKIIEDNSNKNTPSKNTPSNTSTTENVAPETETQETNSVQTGVETNTVSMMGSMITSLFGLGFLRRKKH